MAPLADSGVRNDPATRHLCGLRKAQRYATDGTARAPGVTLALLIAVPLLLVLAGCRSAVDTAPPVITVVVERIVVVTSEPTHVPPTATAEARAPTRTPDPTRTTGPTRTPRPTRTPQPTRTPAPSRTPTPDLPSIIAAMSMVPGGQGVPEASNYDSGAPGPHRLVILESSGASHHWNDDALVTWWTPWTMSETELVVVVEERKVSLDSQEYGARFPFTVHRCRLDLDVQVRSARTGQVVLTTTLEGPEPGPFPISVASGTKEILGSPVPYHDLEDWLACRVGLGVCLRPLRRLEGHTGGVECSAYSPNGQTLASGSKDKTVRLWRVSDGTLLRTLGGPADDVDGLAFSPDGLTLASASRDSTVHLWRVSDGVLLHALDEHAGPVTSVAFAPDGQTLASGSDDDTVRIWRVADGVLLRTLEGHSKGVSSVAFSPDGEALASGSYDDTVRLWRVTDGALLDTLEGHTDPVASVAFSPDGQTLATGSWDDTVRLWRVSDGASLHTFEGHPDTVTSVAFSPDGQTLASYSAPLMGITSPRVHLWRLTDRTLLRTLRIADGVESANGVAISPDWQTLALALPEWAVRLWQIDGSPGE